MGFFGSITKLAMDVVTTPIAIVKDVATLGGAITDEESAVLKKARQIENGWDDLRNELDK